MSTDAPRPTAQDETNMTEAEFAILGLIGWKAAGGSMLDGVMCPAFKRDGQRAIKQRSAWRAIIDEAEATDPFVKMVGAALWGRVEIARNLYAAALAAERERCAAVIDALAAAERGMADRAESTGEREYYQTRREGLIDAARAVRGE